MQKITVASTRFTINRLPVGSRVRRRLTLLVALVAASGLPGVAHAWRYTVDNVLAVARHSSFTTLDGVPEARADRGPGASAGSATDLVPSASERLLAVAAYPGGRVIAAGCAVVAGRQRIIVVRYTADGGLDTSFNRKGRVILHRVAGCAHAIAVQADGMIVVAGYSGSDAGQVVEVFRLKENGSYDRSFNKRGAAGRVQISFHGATAQAAHALAIQPDGKIVVVGEVTVRDGKRFAVARLTTNGGFDRSFGPAGRRVTNFVSGMETAVAVTLQPDGKILVAGWADAQLALARYTAHGALDKSFGDGTGVVLTDLQETTWELIGALHVDEDDSIVAAGYGFLWETQSSVLISVRYDAGGAVASAALNDFAASSAESWEIKAVAMDDEGRIVATGAGQAQDECGLARYHADGARDLAFGHQGTLRTFFSHPRGPAVAWCNAVAVDPSTAEVLTGGMVGLPPHMDR